MYTDIALMREKISNWEYTPVFYQPKLTKIKLSNLEPEPLIKWAFICRRKNDAEEFGKTYNTLVQEYKPLLDWAFLSWDYLVTTQGIRYLHRGGREKYFCHGDYQAFTPRHYKKLLYRCFKELLFNYSLEENFTTYLRKNFWDKVVREYDILRIPKNKKERLLTEYSYLRCVPYKFFNSFHENKVRASLNILNKIELQVKELYFLKFYSEKACAQEMNVEINDIFIIKNQALNKIKFYDLLSYSLLKQIERY